MFDEGLLHTARLLVADAEQARLRIVTAESCTGGLVAALLTSVAGSSAVFERGFVTYSNSAKTDLLGVPTDMLLDCGAVSEPVARAMAEGALRAANAHIAISVTGIAGPGGGTATKPVGLVHFASARANRPILHRMQMFGPLGRSEIRMASVAVALDMLRGQL